jgi:hypothetical protein
MIPAVRLGSLICLLFAFLGPAAAIAEACPARSHILKLLSETPGYQIPDFTSICNRLDKIPENLRTQALAPLAFQIDKLDDPAILGADRIKNLDPTELMAAKQALRALQYLRFFEATGRKPESSYFLGAAIMSIGLMNLHSAYITSTGGPRAVMRPLNARTPPGHFTDYVTFPAFNRGNAIIFRDLAPRTALAAKCNFKSLRGANIGKALFSALTTKKFPLAEDPPKCKEAMSDLTPGHDWAIKFVECEQDIAQNTMLTLNQFPAFATATRTAMSVSPIIRAPLVVEPDGSAPIDFQSLIEYWDENPGKTQAVYANFDYRVPWMKRQLNQVREIVKQQHRFDIDRLMNDVAANAAFYLAPVLGDKCDVNLSPFVVHTNANPAIPVNFTGEGVSNH